MAFASRDDLKIVLNLKQELGGDHKAIDRTLWAVAAAVEGANYPSIQDALRTADAQLRRHFSFEEDILFAAIEPEHPQKVALLREEHARLLNTLDELVIEAELHTLHKQRVDDILAQLRNHANQEDKTLYTWVESLPVKAQKTISRAHRHLDEGP